MLDGNESIQDSIIKLSKQNPGAIRVLVDLYKSAKTIDPYITYPSYMLLNLDTAELYGSDIWILYKDICKKSYVCTHTGIRATQMGIIQGKQLKEGFDFPETLERVQEKLDGYAKGYEHGEECEYWKDHNVELIACESEGDHIH